MLTKNQNTAFWLMAIAFGLIQASQIANVTSRGIQAVVGPLTIYGVYRLLWWVANKIKPVREGQSTTLRVLLILFWPFVLAVPLVVFMSVVGLFLR